MDDSLRVHAEALADLDRQVEAARAASTRRAKGRWHSSVEWSDRPDTPAGEWLITEEEHGGPVVRAIAVTREIAVHILASDPAKRINELEGRKRILQRHAPGDFLCSGCGRNDVYWPCPDWRDAAGQETPDG